MGKLELLEIIAAFPDRELENIIMGSARERFFQGDWGAACAITGYILGSGTSESFSENFRARAAAFDVFMAARARDGQRALASYHYLEGLGANEAILGLRAEALFHLADVLLPDEAPLLGELWQKACCGEMPPMARQKCAAIGELLRQRFSACGDKGNLEKTQKRGAQKLGLGKT